MSIRDFTILAKLGIFIIIKDKELTLPSTKFKDLQMVSLMLSKKLNLAISQIKKPKTLSIKFVFLLLSVMKTSSVINKPFCKEKVYGITCIPQHSDVVR